MAHIECEKCRRVIVTSYVDAPIPTRQFDWAAWFDDVGEEGPCASADSGPKAIGELCEQHCEHYP